MKHAATSLLVFTMVAAAAAAQPSPDRVPASCDRRCLESLVDRYLAAVVAHDPRRLPLSADVKYTENEQALDVGDGFWRTASGIGNYKHYFADPVTGQAAWMGTMTERSAPLLMALRLKVRLGRITEIETSYFRAGGGGPNDIAGMDARGAPATNAPSGRATPGGFDYMALDCKKQLESGYRAIVTSVHQRRYPLVDEERGVLWSKR